MTHPTDPPPRSITFRSVAIGSLLVAIVCLLLPYNDYVVGNTFLIGSYLPLSVVLATFAMVVFVNAPLLKFAPSRALATGELAVILTMLLVGCGIPGQGLLRSFIPSLVSPFYFGQSNQPFWNAFIKLGLPAWMFPVESIADGRGSEIVQQFYGRTPDGQSMPLSAWVKPLLGWSTFFISLFTTLISLAFLFRVQWGANERLAFPLAQLQLSLIEPPERGRALNRLFRDRGFWIAAAAVLFIHSLTALNAYFPRHFTAIPLSFDFADMLDRDPWRSLPWDIKVGRVYFTFIGIAYFVQSRTAFSLWSVWVITQIVTLNVRIVGGNIPLEAWRDQQFGACVVYVLGVFWLGRQYWWRIITSYLSRDPLLREGRFALAAAVAGTAAMFIWLMLFGVQPAMALLIVGVILLAHISTCRIVAETGLPFIRTQVAAQQIFMNFPPAMMNGRSAFFATFFTGNGAYLNRESAMCFTQHALRVDEQAGIVPRRSRGLAAVIAWTLLLSFVIASASSLAGYYGYSSQLGSGEPVIENKYGLTDMPESTIVKPFAAWADGRFTRPPHNPWAHLAIGAAVTTALQLLTWRLSWWPFVPVGYVASGALFISQIWFSIMIGWLAKVIIVRFGGAGFFQRMHGIFIGLIVGEAMAAAVWLVVNMLLASSGHDYFPVRILPG